MIWAGLVTLVVGAVATVWSATASGGSAGSGSWPAAAGIILLVLGGLMAGAGLVRRRLRRRAARRRGGVLSGPTRPGEGGWRPATDLRDAAYRTSRGRMAAMVLAAVYIISPIDLIPDILLPVGIVDDATALTWLVFAVSREYGRRRAGSPQPMTGVEAVEPYGVAPPRREAQITPPSKRSPR